MSHQYKPLPKPENYGEVEIPFDKWLKRIPDLMALHNTYFAQVNPFTVAANTTATQNFTVKGLHENDIVTAVNKPSHQANLFIVNYNVVSKDTLEITYKNDTGGGILPATEIYKIATIRR